MARRFTWWSEASLLEDRLTPLRFSRRETPPGGLLGGLSLAAVLLSQSTTFLICLVITYNKPQGSERLYTGGQINRKSSTDIWTWEEADERWMVTGVMLSARYKHGTSTIDLDLDTLAVCQLKNKD